MSLQRRTLVCGVLLSIAGAGAAGGQAGPSPLIARLDSVIQRRVTAQRIPGLAVGVLAGGKPVYAKGFGVAKLGLPEPVGERSVFYMASITKLFVATGIMQLVEQGKLALDEPVAKYLPYFRLADERYRRITLRQMLNHTSGMPDETEYHWDKPEYDAGALERYVRSLALRPLVREPGTGYRYSNITFEILGDVISKVSGETFDDYVQRHILTPLRMQKSTTLIRETDPQLLVAPHVANQEGGAFAVSPIYPYNRAHAPSSTLFSNAEDMLRWAQANVNRGELDGARILQRGTYDELWRPTAWAVDNLGFRSGVGIGVGWYVKTVAGHRFVAHSGGDIGFGTFLLLAPDDGAAVVVMANSDAVFTDVRELARLCMYAVLGLDPAVPAVELPTLRPSSAPR